MAPVAKMRTSMRAKARPTRAAAGVKPRTSFPSSEDTFSSTKKDKRTMKRSIFVNKIEKASSKAMKRRRPSKKLVTTLDSLADALPEADGEDDAGETVVGEARIRHKSLKTRPGAMKRKERLEKLERDRFDKNMAQMVAGTQVEDASAPAAQEIQKSWKALRQFIEETMEQKAEFRKT